MSNWRVPDKSFSTNFVGIDEIDCRMTNSLGHAHSENPRQYEPLPIVSVSQVNVFTTCYRIREIIGGFESGAIYWQTYLF